MATRIQARLSVAALLVFWAGLTALAQPGLCPCWLASDVREFHPHFDGHPERPHSHGYLFEMFPAGVAVLAEPLVAPAASLILALALAARLTTRTQAAIFNRPWAPLLLTPPPR